MMVQGDFKVLRVICWSFKLCSMQARFHWPSRPCKFSVLLEKNHLSNKNFASYFRLCFLGHKPKYIFYIVQWVFHRSCWLCHFCRKYTAIFWWPQRWFTIAVEAPSCLLGIDNSQTLHPTAGILTKHLWRAKISKQKRPKSHNNYKNALHPLHLPLMQVGEPNYSVSDCPVFGNFFQGCIFLQSFHDYNRLFSLK